jgi:hypothetical protein
MQYARDASLFNSKCLSLAPSPTDYNGHINLRVEIIEPSVFGFGWLIQIFMAIYKYRNEIKSCMGDLVQISMIVLDLCRIICYVCCAQTEFDLYKSRLFEWA